MNYKLIYNNIIENRKRQPILEGYFETHHIIPKSLGGTDNKENLVNLTAKEHFICHLLLTKMYPVGSVEWKKMLFAFHMMLVCQSENQQRYQTPRNYQKQKELFSKLQSELQSGSKNSQYGTRWYHNVFTLENKKFKENPGVDWKLGRYITPSKRQIENEKLRSEKAKNKIKIEKEKTILYESWFKIYNQKGFEKFCKITNYDKSKQNLVMQFQRYVKDFKPQNGKKRGVFCS